MWTYTHICLLWHCRLHPSSSESWSKDFVHQGRGRTFKLQTILRVTSYITSGPPCGVIVVFLNKTGSFTIAESSTLSIFWKSLLSNVYLCCACLIFHGTYILSSQVYTWNRTVQKKILSCSWWYDVSLKLVYISCICLQFSG